MVGIYPYRSFLCWAVTAHADWLYMLQVERELTQRNGTVVIKVVFASPKSSLQKHAWQNYNEVTVWVLARKGDEWLGLFDDNAYLL